MLRYNVNITFKDHIALT